MMNYIMVVKGYDVEYAMYGDERESSWEITWVINDVPSLDKMKECVALEKDKYLDAHRHGPHLTSIEVYEIAKKVITERY